MNKMNKLLRLYHHHEKLIHGSVAIVVVVFLLFLAYGTLFNADVLHFADLTHPWVTLLEYIVACVTALGTLATAWAYILTRYTDICNQRPPIDPVMTRRGERYGWIFGNRQRHNVVDVENFFRLPRDQHALAPWIDRVVELSHERLGKHLGISKRKLTKIYTRWCSTNPDAILCVGQDGSNGRAKLEGFSVVLPLLLDGFHFVTESRGNNLNLSSAHIARNTVDQPVSAILVDMLAARKNKDRNSQRLWWSGQCALRHLALFYDPRGPKHPLVVVEPDKLGIEKILAELAFTNKQYHDGANFYWELKPDPDTRQTLPAESQRRIDDLLQTVSLYRAGPSPRVLEA
jgi:hypothetical protein